MSLARVNRWLARRHSTEVASVCRLRISQSEDICRRAAGGDHAGFVTRASPKYVGIRWIRQPVSPSHQVAPLVHPRIQRQAEARREGAHAVAIEAQDVVDDHMYSIAQDRVFNFDESTVLFVNWPGRAWTFSAHQRVDEHVWYAQSKQCNTWRSSVWAHHEHGNDGSVPAICRALKASTCCKASGPEILNGVGYLGNLLSTLTLKASLVL